MLTVIIAPIPALIPPTIRGKINPRNPCKSETDLTKTDCSFSTFSNLLSMPSILKPKALISPFNSDCPISTLVNRSSILSIFPQSLSEQLLGNKSRFR